MRLPKFQYFEPTSVEEGCSLLSHEQKAKVMAGGTDLLVAMKQRTLSPSSLINIKNIPEIDHINHDADEGLRIGALTRLRTLENSLIIKEKFSILMQAAGSVGSPQIRNIGTIGGNVCLNTRCFYYNQSSFWRKPLRTCYKMGGDFCHVAKGGDRCHALFSADTAPALIALGSKAKISGPARERDVTLESLYTGDGIDPIALKPDEILTEIQVPNPLLHTGGTYLKYSSRGAINFPMVGVAVVITVSPGDEVCHDAKIVLGSVASAPVRAVDAEKVLEGKHVDNNLVENSAKAASSVAHPVTHMGISGRFKRKMVEVFTRRAIKQAWQLAKTR